METIITIRKNKPAFRNLISLAKELEKKDDSISVFEFNDSDASSGIIAPKNNLQDIASMFDELKEFPTLKQLRKKAWPKISS